MIIIPLWNAASPSLAERGPKAGIIRRPAKSTATMLSTGFLVVALCSVLALANENQAQNGAEEGLEAWPKTLKAQVSEGPEGTAILNVTWDAGTYCAWQFQYTIHLSAKDEHTQQRTTEKTNMIFHDLEFWTNYTVICEAKCVKTHNISIAVNTGPGNPHPIVSVSAVGLTPHIAHVKIVEAQKMPGRVTRYWATYCRETDGFCESKSIIRLKEKPGIVEDTLEGLQHFTVYKLTVVPQIVALDKIYSGDARYTWFKTA